MPRVRRGRDNIPEAVRRHLIRHVRERQVSTRALAALARWLDTDPVVPEGKWFKTFEGFHVCGEGELVLTFLGPGQAPDGEEVG